LHLVHFETKGLLSRIILVKFGNPNTSHPDTIKVYFQLFHMMTKYQEEIGLRKRTILVSAQQKSAEATFNIGPSVAVVTTFYQIQILGGCPVL
jgi:hypothetical protein